MKPRIWQEPIQRVLLGVCLRLARDSWNRVVFLSFAFGVPVALGLLGGWYFIDHCGPCSDGPVWMMEFGLALTALGALTALVYLLCALFVPRSEGSPPRP